MRLVLEAEGVKRDLEGPFRLCASRKDMAELAQQLERILGREDFSYGWVTIYPAPEDAGPNTKPRAWKE